MVFSTRIEAVALAVLLFSSNALADESARARAIALEGKKAYDTNDFDTAIKKYEEAYKLKAAPGILFNLAQSHRRAQHFELAVSYFRRYLETNPPRVQAQAVEKLITETEAEGKAFAASSAEAAQRKQQEEAEARRIELERTRLARASAEEEAERKRLEVEREQSQQRRLDLERALTEQKTAEAQKTPITQRWWFWTALGVVAAGAAATTVAVVAAPQPAATTFADINAR